MQGSIFYSFVFDEYQFSRLIYLSVRIIYSLVHFRPFSSYQHHLAPKTTILILQFGLEVLQYLKGFKS